MQVQKEDAKRLFGQAQTVSELRLLIKENAHFWFDEDLTIRMLEMCAGDAVKAKGRGPKLLFSTVLLGESGPYRLYFEVNEGGRVRLLPRGGSP